MAPRGRPRKKTNNTRMDAAVEAMTKEYGFSDEQLIKKVANQLLKEYGVGDDAWYFIEQYSYNELLEALLRHQSGNERENPDANEDFPADLNDQENLATGEDLIKDDSMEGEKTKEHSLTDVAGPSCIHSTPPCSEIVNEQMEIHEQDENKSFPCTDSDGNSWKDIGLDQASNQRESVDATCGKVEEGSQNEVPVPAAPAGHHPVPPPKFSAPPPSLPPLKIRPPKKRVHPPNGYIDSDEEDKGDEFIEFIPAKGLKDLKPAKRRKLVWFTMELHYYDLIPSKAFASSASTSWGRKKPEKKDDHLPPASSPNNDAMERRETMATQSDWRASINNPQKNNDAMKRHETMATMSDWRAECKIHEATRRATRMATTMAQNNLKQHYGRLFFSNNVHINYTEILYRLGFNRETFGRTEDDARRVPVGWEAADPPPGHEPEHFYAESWKHWKKNLWNWKKK
ncbi:OLC1v1026758C1 [Oldenlandia corymbosa var. corymbosa]|uniref:OLC1v1026758C1 n=1 Tax=Oldenlandia corymbosa var. corymbosa TaxID=529605 RepID=A0AAV1C7U4_OLDCO|nr:OLC1v1026758C1 [Oldenlandia corymbosa var. corymbosa]